MKEELEKIITIAIWGEIIHIDKRDRGNAKKLAEHITPYVLEFFEREEVFYTPEQIAKILQLDLQTVTKYIRDRKLEAIALGKGYRIPKTYFERFVEERTNRAN